MLTKAEIERLKELAENYPKREIDEKGMVSEWRISERGILELIDTIERMAEAMEEFAKPPYADSDTASLLKWVNTRASAISKEYDGRE